MWLCCPPGRKTLRPVFSRRGSDANWVCYVHKVCPLCQLSNQDTIFHVIFFILSSQNVTKNMPPINAFCINCYILIKPQSVDAFCTKNFSLMQNASTLPTHFVTKNQNVPIVTLVQNALYHTLYVRLSLVLCFRYNIRLLVSRIDNYIYSVTLETHHLLK